MELKSGEIYKELEISKLNLHNKRVEDIEFINCLFVGCDFSDTTFFSCVFDNCDFTSCNLSNVKLSQSNLIDPVFNHSKLLGVDFTLLRSRIAIKIIGNSTNFDYAIFSGKNISNSVFTKCEFKDSEFVNSDLTKTIFSECDFERSIFLGTNLSYVNMKTSFNFVFDPSKNNCKELIIDIYKSRNLLLNFGIKVEE